MCPIECRISHHPTPSVVASVVPSHRGLDATVVAVSQLRCVVCLQYALPSCDHRASLQDTTRPSGITSRRGGANLPRIEEYNEAAPDAGSPRAVSVDISSGPGMIARCVARQAVRASGAKPMARLGGAKRRARHDRKAPASAGGGRHTRSHRQPICREPSEYRCAAHIRGRRGGISRSGSGRVGTSTRRRLCPHTRPSG